MKKNELTMAVLSALLFVSSSVMAGADYPAADFQPKVVFSDPSAAQSKAEPGAASKVAEPVEVDPNYPATNYQPKVLYSDSGYTHSSVAPAIAGSSSSSVISSGSEEASVESASESKSSNNNLFGLLALAAVGGFLYSKKTKQGAAGSAGLDVAAGGATGVEKYLDKLGVNKTGVAKYLEKQTENPATGVAKYVAKQVIKDREVAASKATGVEKYLRDKA